jgi:CubicO group peptidase (beta-lactamase class C family)
LGKNGAHGEQRERAWSERGTRKMGSKESMPSASSITSEDIAAVRAAMRKEMDRSSDDERKVTGGWLAVAGSADPDQDFTFIAEGTTRNALGEEVSNDDPSLMRGMASSVKMMLVALVYRMVHEGILALTTHVEEIIPGYAPGPDSKIRVLRDLYTDEDADGAQTCVGKSGGERVVVFKANDPQQPAWSTEDELAALKEKLEPLSRPITLAHLLTHTSGIVAVDMANDFGPAHITSGFFPLTATNAAESILGVPDSLGIMADQPGEKPYYDGSYLFLNGLVEVAYNKEVNGIPVAKGMSDDPKFDNLAIIFEKLLGGPMGFKHKVCDLTVARVRECERAA